MKFEWYNEEDSPLREAEALPVLPEVARRRWPLGVFLLLLSLGLGGWLFFRQIQQRSVEAVANLENDVLATHNLVWQSGRDADLELFISYLSGSDQNWALIQQSIVAGGAFFDRPELGLHWQPSTTAAISVTLSPNLSEAVVVTPERYQVTTYGGLTQTVTLWQTSIYRQGLGRWLFAPPHPDYWGGLDTIHLDKLNITYPNHDQDIIQQMAPAIAILLQRICQDLPEIACPSSFGLDLSFSNDPNTLLNKVVWYDGNRRLILPTPSLIGRPADEAAFAALLAIYERLILSKAITNIVGWECCNGGLFFQALLNQQLTALELPIDSLPAATYEQLLSRHLNYDDVYGLWNFPPSPIPEENQYTAQILVDFLLQQQPSLTAAAWQRQLVLAGSYDDWLSQLSNTRPELLTQKWKLYLFDHAYSQTSGLPAPLPQQDIVAVCQTADDPSIVSLLQFDPNSGDITPAIPGWQADYKQTWATVYPTPAGQGFWLVEQNSHSLKLTQWQNKQATWDLLLENHTLIDLSPGQDRLILQNTQLSENYLRLLDLNHCQNGDCDLLLLAGLPTWSPDEKWMVMSKDNGQLWLSDGLGQLLAGVFEGMNPIWLDNEHFAYFQFGANQVDVFIISVTNPIPRLLFQSDDLRQVLPAGQSPDHSWQPVVLADPAGANQLFVAFMTNTAHIFAYRLNWATGKWSFLFNYQWADPYSLRVSDDGHWLSLAADHNGSIVLFDNQTGHLTAFGGTSGNMLWSPGNQWLISFDQGLVYWLAPDYGYARPVSEPGLARCGKMIWVGNE